MKKETFKMVASAIIAATVLASSSVSANAGAGSFRTAGVDNGAVEVVKTGGRKHRGKHRHFRKHRGHDVFYYNYGYPYYGGGCQWRKKRFWNGHSHYWRKVRVCF